MSAPSGSGAPSRNDPYDPTDRHRAGGAPAAGRGRPDGNHHGAVEVPEIPRAGAVVLPAQRSAVVVVDLQNDFAHPDGALFGEEAPAIVPRVADLTARARDAGALVAYTQDWHGEDDPEFAVWGAHARAGSWGAQLVEGLDPRPDDVRIRKLRYDAFYGTPLDHQLRTRGVEHLALVGTVANICVLHTAASAGLRGYEVVVAEDAVAALTGFDRATLLRQVTFLYGGRVAPAAAIHFA